MAKTYFSQYIDDINRIINEAIHKHDMAFIALANARTRNEKAQANREYSADKKLVEAAQYREAVAEHKKSVQGLQDEATAAFKTLRQSLEKHIAEYTAADPTKVDQSAVMLLNSGAMSDTDLVALANRYWGNPTMLKLIGSQAEQLMKDSRTARLLSANIAEHISPVNRLGNFDDAVDVAMRAIQDNERTAGVFQKEWAERFYPTAKNNMSALDSFNMEV